MEGEAALVGGGQEGDAADLAQVHPHGVVNDVALDVILLRVGDGFFGLFLGRRDLFGVGLFRNVVGGGGLRERGRQGVGVVLGVVVRRGSVGIDGNRGFLGLDGGGGFGRSLSGGGAFRLLRLFRCGLCRFRGGFGRRGLGRRGLGRGLGAGFRRAFRRLRLLDVFRWGRLFRGQRCFLLGSARRWARDLSIIAHMAEGRDALGGQPGAPSRFPLSRGKL